MTHCAFSSSPRRGAIHLAAGIVALAAVCGAKAQTAPLMRYNAVVESAFVLDRCNALTPERRAYLRRLTDLAMRPLAWSSDQWAAHDAGLQQELQRLYPSVPKERCEEVVRSLDQEMRK